jgi:hypothetical protein
MRTFILATTLALTLPAACSGTTVTSGALSACAWPASLDPPDAGSWTVGRAFLSCKDGPDFAGCVSDDLTTCPRMNPIPGGTYTNCVDQCHSDEYAVATGGPPILEPDGGIGFPPQPVLPAACRSVDFTPGGVTYSCCPCQ